VPVTDVVPPPEHETLHCRPAGQGTPPSPTGVPPLELLLPVGKPPVLLPPLLPPLPLLAPLLPLLPPLPFPPLLANPLPLSLDALHAGVVATLATSAAPRRVAKPSE
jgi:hypothetical protein